MYRGKSRKTSIRIPSLRTEFRTQGFWNMKTC